MLERNPKGGVSYNNPKPSHAVRVGEVLGFSQKTVAEMSMYELIRLRNRIYSQKRKNDNPRLDLQLHAVQGELKDRGFHTKHSMQEGSFMLYEKLTKKKLEEMKPGVFAQGTIEDGPEGINMTGSHNLLRWVAVRGYAPDWAIYVHWATNSWEFVRTQGDKIYNKENAKKLIECDEEALELYRD